MIAARGRAVRPVASPAQAGVALAIVLWFIAGMSLLVAGIVSQARVDTHMAQVHVARARAAAAGDGAIRLTLADLVTARQTAFEQSRDEAGNYRLGEDDVSVQLVPVAGLVDVNSATADVLAGLFLEAGLADQEARAMAENVLQSRSATAVAGRPAAGGRFAAMEDLLRVPGMSRSLLDAVRDLIVVGPPAQGTTNWAVAPPEVLAVLERLDEGRAAAMRARREAGAQRSGPAVLARAYRADAVLRYGNRNWLRRQWIEMSPAPGSELPWRVVRTEPPRVMLDKNEMMGRAADAG